MAAPLARPAPERPQFVRNTWYIAALRSELDGPMLARTILGTSVNLYRTSDGTPVALRNRCPHRGYPLSEGTLGPDDVITCGYHGFRFGPDGRHPHKAIIDFIMRLFEAVHCKSGVTMEEVTALYQKARTENARLSLV